MKKMEYPYEVSAGKTLYRLQVITNNLTSKDLFQLNTYGTIGDHNLN